MSEEALPRRVCDIVLKGGITSGIVYPLALVKLAEKYRFSCIGGTSAGAIAAAACAAAEYGRAVEIAQTARRRRPEYRPSLRLYGAANQSQAPCPAARRNEFARTDLLSLPFGQVPRHDPLSRRPYRTGKRRGGSRSHAHLDRRLLRHCAGWRLSPKTKGSGRRPVEGSCG